MGFVPCSKWDDGLKLITNKSTILKPTVYKSTHLASVLLSSESYTVLNETSGLEDIPHQMRSFSAQAHCCELHGLKLFLVCSAHK